VNGREITRLSRSQLADWRGTNIGYILQSHNLIAVLTVYENVELPLRLLPHSASQRHARVQRTLQTVHLIGCAGCYPRHLSCGEEERAAIARATVANPPILLGDEPTGSLDPGGSQEVVDLLEELNVQLGMTLIVATSDSRLAAVARRKFRLVGGQLAELHDDGSVLHEPW
jgi:putative ABC transport system ATP-binding protein